MQVLDPGKIVTLYQILGQLTEEEISLLRALALEMNSFSDYYLVHHKKLFSGSRTKCTALLQRFEQLRVIFRSRRDYGEYRIMPLFHLFLLLETVKNPDTESRNFMNHYYNEEDEDFLPHFFAFIGKGSPWKLEETTESVIYDLLLCFPYFEELIPIFHQFSSSLKSECWRRYRNQQLATLRPVNWNWFDENVTPGIPFGNNERIANNEENAFMRYFVRGIEAPETVTDMQTISGLLFQAILVQNEGDFQKANILYEQAVKLDNRLNPGQKLSFPNDSFYAFSYAVSLIREGNERTEKKIQTLLRKKEIKEDNRFFPTYLLLSASTQSTLTRDINRTAVYRLSNQLTALLYTWVCKNYELPLVEHDLIDEAFVLVKEDDYKGLLAYTAALYPEMADETVITTTFLPPFRKLQPWEAVLEKLLKDPDVAPKPDKRQQESSSARIIYLLSRNLEVTPVLQRAKEGDSWKGGRKIAIKTFSEGIPEMNETDRQVAATVRRYRAQWGYSYEYILGGEETLAALAGYPLVFLFRNPEIPVAVVKQQPYISLTRQGEVFRIQTNILNPDNNSLIQITPESDTHISVLQLTKTQLHIIQQLTRVTEYPIAAEPMLKELLCRISGTLTIHSDLVDTEQKLTQKTGDTTPVVQILPLGECFKAELFVKPLGNYPPYCKPGIGNRSVMGMIDGENIQAVRNFRTETAMQQPIREIFKDFDQDATDTLTLESTADCLELLEQLHEQGDSVKIEWPEGERMKVRNRASSSGFSIIARKNNTWFEIDGSLRISKNEEMQILDLMKKVSESDTRFIRLEGNEYLALTGQLRQQLIELNSLLHEQKDKMLLSVPAAPILDSFEKGGITVTKDSHYEKLLARINEASRREYRLPENLQANLREYQEEGYRWMERLSDWGAGACLADDMGLGKTVQAIAVLLEKASHGASLVVAPASVLTNWEHEIHRFAPSLNVRNLNTPGIDRQRLIAEAGDFDIVITTYGLLIGEADKLQEKKWNTIVLDEAHTIKNRETKMSKAAMGLKGDFRLILTGTPLQNHLSEIWNLSEFINPGLLGSFRSFTEHFIMPIELRQDKHQQKLLKRILSPFILRRTKNEVLNELPSKTEILLPVDLSKEELTLYETMRRKAEMSLKSKDLNAVKTLAEITRLRQAACHPALVKPGYTGPTSKTALFMELIDELRENNHRALVFSQFTSHLALIREALDRKGIEYLYLDGAIPTTQRSKLVKQFQTGMQPVFLISLKAGGLGLNLTAADFIIHLDPWWNPAIEDQASDRAYRIGQTRPVTVYRLISRHTIEEKIIELHHTKKDLADSLLEGTNLAHKMTREEMLRLLGKE